MTTIDMDIDLRDDVVAEGHGEPTHVPPGTTCDAIDAARFLVGIHRFGASAPAAKVFEEVGLTATVIADRVRRLLERPADESAAEVVG